MKRQEEELRESTRDSNNSNTNNSSVNGDNVVEGGNQGIFGSALANIFVIIGFAAFAYTVKCVLRSVVE